MVGADARWEASAFQHESVSVRAHHPFWFRLVRICATGLGENPLSDEVSSIPGDEVDAGDPRTDQIHGSLVEVAGIGVLILGPSGVGKSECVIELVRRGQRLVADDVVRLRAEPGSNHLTGWAPAHIRHFIEVRGLGLMSVSDLFGAEATLDECEVGFVVRLEDWGKGIQFERIGLEREREILLGIEIPTVRLPVHAASNLATLVELAIRDWQLRLEGVNAARRLDERLRARGGILADGGSAEGEEA
jgi:HPr kinase/phosphorylase